MKITRTNRLYRQLIATSLILGGTLQMVAPVLAAGTAAGQAISNTATGTYQDQNNPGVPINSTSNTVTITVAEVAGITVTASGVSNQNGSSAAVVAGSTLYYTYTVTNVGNAPTDFRIPNLATVTGPGVVSGNVSYTIGGTTTTITGSESITPAIPVGGTVIVQVPITVNSTATSGQSVSVQLGQAPNNGQNVPRVPANGGDVYTVVPASDPNGPPVNGVREASATQAASIGGTITPQAFATIFKTHGTFTNSTPSDITKGSLSYSLSLQVASTAPAGSTLTPSNLLGTSINLGGTQTTEVLISDAIPAGTVLTAAPTSVPAGWTAVYSTDDPTVSNKAANDPAVAWTSTAPTTPATLAAVKRIGFIAAGPITTGTTVTGFTITVSPTANVTTTIYNIAQVFGQTTAGAISASNPLVYDESGDQEPNNYNANGTPPATNTPNNGVANPGTDGTDSNNNNTASARGGGGEDNVFSISGPTSAGVLNGPNGAPAATGPSGGNNDDYTNKSVQISATAQVVDTNGNPVALTTQPGAVSFSNTVENTNTGSENISLVPATPANATDLPNGTTVTISYGANSATYSYTQGSTTGINGGPWSVSTTVPPTGTANGSPISATNPLSIPAVAANATANYGVGIQLPASNVNTLTGYPVTINAFVPTTQASGPLSTDAQNKTIDRIYTGFLKLYKESRIIQGNGPALLNAADASFSNTPKKPAPGNTIEYRITYTNISTSGGSGDIVLSASQVSLTEDGTGTGSNQASNNWAKDNDGNGVIDTSNVIGKAADSNGGTVTFYSGSPATTPAVDEAGTTQSTDVTKYIDTVPGAVAPGASGTFIFDRLVN